MSRCHNILLTSNEVCSVKRSIWKSYGICYDATTFFMCESDFLKIVQSCYEWEQKIGTWQPDNNFQIILSNVSININPKDFSKFSEALFNAALKEYKILDFLYGNNLGKFKPKILC